MKIKKLLTAVLAIIAVFAITLSVSAESSSNGWYQKPNGNWAYSVDGVDYENGIKEIDGEYYYISNGKLIEYEECVAIGGSYYAFGYSGQMLKNTAHDGRLYGSDGAMITTDGWHYLDGEWYYVTGGYAATGIHLIGGVQYCFDYYGQLA